jgi:hypothetical protein
VTQTQPSPAKEMGIRVNSYSKTEPQKTTPPPPAAVSKRLVQIGDDSSISKFFIQSISNPLFASTNAHSFRTYTADEWKDGFPISVAKQLEVEFARLLIQKPNLKCISTIDLHVTHPSYPYHVIIINDAKQKKPEPDMFMNEAFEDHKHEHKLEAVATNNAKPSDMFIHVLYPFLNISDYSFEGKKVEQAKFQSEEELTHCVGLSENMIPIGKVKKNRERWNHVIGYYITPWSSDTIDVDSFEGYKSVCLQHMDEIFRGRVKCTNANVPVEPPPKMLL